MCYKVVELVKHLVDLVENTEFMPRRILNYGLPER